MTKKNVQHIIRKSVIDRAFAKKLAENPEDVLKDYDLTHAEKVAIRHMQVEFERKNHIVKKADDHKVLHKIINNGRKRKSRHH
ncbi:hypothetical protein ACFLQ8_02305 [Candidatus Auribacterota bacterium]